MFLSTIGRLTCGTASMILRKYMLRKLGIIICLLASAGSLCAQDNFFQKWEARTTQTQAKQPSWSVPLFAPYPMLIQVFRFDAMRQITPTRTSTWNYGAGRGLNLVPGFNSEFDVYNPPYLQHHSSTTDGFGDVAFLYKYRILSGNQKHGNYALSMQVVATIPTGDHANGSTDASISPTLLAGKGFGRFDVISSLGATLPTSDTVKLGRSVAWNTTAQYHLGKYLWPEIETNATYFFGGKNDGRSQNFLTPGITTSKFKFRPKDEQSRTGIALGAGMQIATSQFHTYNHQLLLTSRLIF
jgi:hypothetical protein